MAEVSQFAGLRAHIFALKGYGRCLPGSQSKWDRRAAHTPSPSAGFPPDDTDREAENPSETRTSGVSLDSYSRVAQLVGGVLDDLEKEHIAENCHYRDVQILTLPGYRNFAKFLRTLSPASCLQRTGGGRYPHLGHLVSARGYSGDGGRSEPLYRTKTGYYEILEVSPIATQAQIKTAYYKQSFVYHPDRNAGSEEATVRFSEISEAYTVLGNKGLRKKYDRGLLSLSDLTATVRPSAKDAGDGSAGPLAQSRRSVMGTDSRGGIFDFDEFYKSHYNEQLQRQRDIRVRKEDIMKKKQTSVGDKKLDKMMEVGVGMLMIFAMGIILSLKQS
ncbi:uncharacterized protein ACNS7B_000623 [Menidia menidia]